MYAGWQNPGIGRSITQLRCRLFVSAGLVVASLPTLAADRMASAGAPAMHSAELAQTLPNTRIVPGSEARASFLVEAGAIVLDVNINGRGTFPMMFDTGARNSLTPEAAATLGIKVEGAETVRDSGDRTISTGVARVSTVRLGDVEMTDQPFAVVALPPYLTDRGNQPALAGLIGYELLERFATRLDYDHQTLTFQPGANFRYDGAGTRLPLDLVGNLPAVPAASDGIPGRFVLDTASIGALTLRPEFVAMHGLAARHPSVLRIRSIGAAGPFEAFLTRLDRFDIAESRIDAPAARFPSRVTSAEPAGFDGTVGYEILRQFIITFDYAHHEIWLDHSNAFGAKTGRGSAGFQAVGIADAGFSVITVLPNSAAAAAGMRVGDLITEINGQPTKSMSLAELAQMMRAPDGTLVHLGLLRESVPYAVDLTLRDVLPLASQ
jgi:hypothetical protein